MSQRQNYMHLNVAHLMQDKLFIWNSSFSIKSSHQLLILVFLFHSNPDLLWWLFELLLILILYTEQMLPNVARLEHLVFLGLMNPCCQTSRICRWSHSHMWNFRGDSTFSFILLNLSVSPESHVITAIEQRVKLCFWSHWWCIFPSLRTNRLSHTLPLIG